MKWQTNAHLEKARFNYAFSEQIADLGDDYRGWRVTVLFYSIVHMIEGYFVENGLERSRSHSDRDATIRGQPDLVPLWRSYSRLKDFSRTARYETVPINDAEVGASVSAHETIYDHIAGLLGVSVLHPPKAEPESSDAGPSDS